MRVNRILHDVESHPAVRSGPKSQAELAAVADFGASLKPDIRNERLPSPQHEQPRQTGFLITSLATLRYLGSEDQAPPLAAQSANSRIDCRYDHRVLGSPASSRDRTPVKQRVAVLIARSREERQLP